MNKDIEIKELRDILIYPIDHENMEITCSKNYYDLQYKKNKVTKITYKEDGRNKLILGQLSTLYIEEVQYTFIISKIEVIDENNDMWMMIVSGDKKNVSYLFLLPLCTIINEIPALPINNVFIDRKDERLLYLQVSKQILNEDDKKTLEYVKEDNQFIYIKDTIEISLLNDIRLIREGKYSRISNKAKELIYKYHISILTKKESSIIYDVLERTEKGREDIYNKYGVVLDKNDELFSKITDKEYYEI